MTDSIVEFQVSVHELVPVQKVVLVSSTTENSVYLVGISITIDENDGQVLTRVSLPLPLFSSMLRLMWVAITFLAATFLILASFVSREAYSWPSSASKMTTRPGKLGDVDELVDLVLVTMGNDPEWDYCFEHTAEYRSSKRKPLI